jgi:hypothetical protein
MKEAQAKVVPKDRPASDMALGYNGIKYKNVQFRF